MKSGVSSLPGISILMTCAPQSASCRTAVGPARARVRSRTVYLASAVDAGAGRIGVAFLLGLARSQKRPEPAVGTLVTRRDRNACRGSTLPSPLSCFFARHHRFPQSPVLPARRERSLTSGDSTAREREHGRGGAVDDLFLLLFGEYRPCPRPFPRQHTWAGSALHGRLVLENLIRALLMFNELRSRHGQ